MDLMCTVYAPKKSDSSGFVQRSRWFYESATLCAVSAQNTLAFVSSYPLDAWNGSEHTDDTYPLPQYKSKLGDRGHSATNSNQSSTDNEDTNCMHRLYVCDLNTPWDVRRITSKSTDITCIAWDSDFSNTLVIADKSGQIEMWQMREELLTEWRCVGRAEYPDEVFLKAMFLTGNRRTYINMDKQDSKEYHDKFNFHTLHRKTGRQFGEREMMAVVLVSHTGLAVCLATTPKCPDGGTTRLASKSLGNIRERVKKVDMTLTKSGEILVAITNGDPRSPVRMYSVKPRVRLESQSSATDGISVDLDVGTFPGIFINATSTEAKNEEDACHKINDIKFVIGDDRDSFLVATEHPAGGRVELWELRKIQHSVHKMLMPPTEGSSQDNSLLTVSSWNYVEVFSGPPSQIVSMATPLNAFQCGKSRAAACYVTVGYSDGSIQCLIRDGLQQIGSAELPKTGNMPDEPSAKMPRSSVNICDMAFSSTGSVLVTVDSLGQLYLYRMSPIMDPGGPHVPLSLQTMLEYCLVSGLDWWDVTICMKQSQIEEVAKRLEEDFKKQSAGKQDYYFLRHTSMKSSIYRLLRPSLEEYKAADCYAVLMLTSISGALKGLLSPTDINFAGQSPAEKVSIILQNNKKDEANVDTLVDAIQSFHHEFNVEPAVLQSHFHLMQWITNLTLVLMASVPDFKHRKGPGYDLISEKKNLNILRELLFLIRLWGRTNENILPTFTKTTDSFDVVAKLFSLLTRFKESSEEAILDECISLPSQVMIPPLDIVIAPRGLASIVVSQNKAQLNYEFGIEPELSEGGGDITFLAAMKSDEAGLLGSLSCSSTNQLMDTIRHTYLGRKPFITKQCTRCAATTLPLASSKKGLKKGWDMRWYTRCPCGGPWGLTCLDSSASQKRKDLLSCVS